MSYFGHLAGGKRRQVENEVTDTRAHAWSFIPVREHAIGQVVDVVERTAGALNPRRDVTHAYSDFRSGSRSSSTRSRRGSRTLHDPKDVNQRRAEVRPSLPVSSSILVMVLASDASRMAATSSGAAPSRLALVASNTLRKPWCSKPDSASRCRSALCSPAVHLNGSSRSRAAAMQAASSPDEGNDSADAPPMRNFSRMFMAAISSSATSQEGVGLSLIHISEPTRRTPISYAVFCLKK